MDALLFPVVDPEADQDLPPGPCAAPAARPRACCAALERAACHGALLPFDAYRCRDGELDHLPRLQAEWVFGYGSLIWDPGFPYAERHIARIHGYHRKYCITSTRYRGTAEQPGIVLGLDAGGSCQGIVYRFPPELAEACVELLYHREMSNLSYEPLMIDVALADGRAVRALTFVACRYSDVYEDLASDEVLRRLSRSSGTRGPNRDYAINTWTALTEWGIEDAELAAIAQALDHRPG